MLTRENETKNKSFGVTYAKDMGRISYQVFGAADSESLTHLSVVHITFVTACCVGYHTPFGIQPTSDYLLRSMQEDTNVK